MTIVQPNTVEMMPARIPYFFCIIALVFFVFAKSTEVFGQDTTATGTYKTALKLWELTQVANFPAEKVIPNGLMLLEELKKQKEQQSDFFNTVKKTVKDSIYKQMMISPSEGSMLLFSFLIRYDAVVDGGNMGGYSYIKELNKKIRNFRNEQPGIAPYFKNWGQLTVNCDKHMLVYKDDNTRIVVELNLLNGEYVPEYVMFCDYFGVYRCFSFNGQNFKEEYNLYKIKNKQSECNVYVRRTTGNEIHCPANFNDTLYQLNIVDGLLELNPEPIILNSNNIVNKKNTTLSCSIFANNGSVEAFDKSEVLCINKINNDGYNALRGYLANNGYSNVFINTVCSNLVKPENTVYANGSSIFVGELKDLNKGNYFVIGINTFDETKLLYRATFKKGNLQLLELSDGLVIDLIKDNSYRLTLRNSDNSKVFVEQLFDNKPKKYSLYWNNYNLVFDYERAMLTQGAYDKLFINYITANANSKPINYAIKTVFGNKLTFKTDNFGINTVLANKQGFQISDINNKNEFVFTLGGHRVKKEDMDCLLPEIVHFDDVLWEMTIKIPLFGKREPYVLNPQRTQFHSVGVARTNSEGKLIVSITQSNVFGEIEKCWDQEY